MPNCESWVNDTCEHIRVELGVLDVAEMFGQVFVRERLGFPLTRFVPPGPPSFDAFSFVNPWLSHTLYCIGGFDHRSHLRKHEVRRKETKRRHEQAEKETLHFKLLTSNGL